jgi:hypothetical protein
MIYDTSTPALPCEGSSVHYASLTDERVARDSVIFEPHIPPGSHCLMFFMRGLRYRLDKAPDGRGVWGSVRSAEADGFESVTGEKLAEDPGEGAWACEHLGGSLQGYGTSFGDKRSCDEPGYREYKSDKGRRRCEVRTLYSSPNTSPATLIDGARHPAWVLNSRHIERASIIRWQGICEVAPPTLLLARNPRAAEQRDSPSTSTRGLVRP